MTPFACVLPALPCSGPSLAAPAMAQGNGSNAGQSHGTGAGDVGNPSANGAVVGSGNTNTGNTGTAKSTRATGVSIGQNAAGAEQHQLVRQQQLPAIAEARGRPHRADVLEAPHADAHARSGRPLRRRRSPAGDARRQGAPAGRPAAPAHARRGGRAGPSARPRGHAHAHAGARLARLADPLGAARAWARPPSRGCWPSGRACISSSSRRCSPAWPTSSARSRRRRGGAGSGQGTLLFVDEIHRFNRAQQDGFLPVVEDGTVVAGRRDHGEPVLRAERRAAVALPGAGAAPARRRRARALLARAEAETGRALPLDAGGARDAARHGRWRRALPAEHGRAAARPCRRADARSTRPALSDAARAARRALRQGPRGALQPDLRAA